jgi:hypothetical protein
MLAALLQFDGSEPKLVALEKHLEQCKLCQDTLQQLAADAEAWQEARAALCDATSAPTPFLCKAITALKQSGSRPRRPRKP